MVALVAQRRCSMAMGKGHYTRRWALLKGVAKEFAGIRTKHKLGRKATQDQIDAAQIFSSRRRAYPRLKELMACLLTDGVLQGRLAEIYKVFGDLRESGVRCERFQGFYTFRIFWRVVRNAERWLATRKPGDLHWGRFWNKRNLIKDVSRTLEQLLPPERQWPEDQARPYQPDSDYAGRGPVDPAELAERLDEACRGLSPQDNEAFRDWYHNAHEHTPAEQEEIARRHALTSDELDAVIRQVSDRLATGS